jgi:hypothetical protein
MSGVLSNNGYTGRAQQEMRSNSLIGRRWFVGFVAPRALRRHQIKASRVRETDE